VHAPPARHFDVVVTNNDTLANDVTIRWARGGLYLGEVKRSVAARAQLRVVTTRLDDQPDLVEIESSALSTFYSRLDWGSHSVLVIDYPRGQIHGEF
jgi:hypothetical protein